MTTSKKVLIAIAIAVLFFLNIRQWFFSDEADGNRQSNTTRGQTSMPLPELHSKMAQPLSEESKQSTRNIFQNKQKVQTETPGKKRRQQPKATPAPKGPTAEELAQAEALRLLQSYKLMGVVYNDGQYQGFISRDDKSTIVKAGDMLENRFMVESVDTHQVVLYDPESGLNQVINLSGE